MRMSGTRPNYGHAELMDEERRVEDTPEEDLTQSSESGISTRQVLSSARIKKYDVINL